MRHTSNRLSLLAALLPMVLSRPTRRGDAGQVPRDISALFRYLEAQGKFQSRLNNLLSQWGPQERPLLSTQFLPPRLVTKNQDTTSDVGWRAVAAEDKTRHSPVVLLDGGEVFGAVSYTLRDSGMARQLTAKDYDGIVGFLGQMLPLVAASVAVGAFDTLIVQGMAEHDELANCDAIVTGGYSRGGSNGYFEYINGPDLDDHRAVMAHEWSDPTYNPWADIEARVTVLTNKGFQRSGIRGMTTGQVRTILKNNPYTAMRVGKSNLVLNSDGTIRAQNLSGIITDEELDQAFRGLGVQVPLTHDLRVPTRRGEKRAFEEGALAFIGATGQTEQVIYNQDDVSAVPLQVNDTIGFNGIGIANAQQTPGRRSATRVFTNQADARAEFEGWQTSGPIINTPEAISVARGIE